MHTRILLAAGVAFLLILIIGLSPLATHGAPATPLYPSDNERIGVDVTTSINNFDVSLLHAGWYANWNAMASPARPDGMKFVQTIRTCDPSHGCAFPYYRPSGDTLISIVEATPGSLWLVGNEPDCPFQDSVFPEHYARIYHDVYTTIKTADPTATVAIGGMVQATPLRMKWLNAVWDYYQQIYGEAMPVDVWNIHTFVLREVRNEYDCDGLGDWGAGIPPGLLDNCGMLSKTSDLDRMDIFNEEVRRFRSWMKEHGQRNKPLIVSEYGILFNQEMGYGYERVRDYMLNTFNYFLNTRDRNIGYPADDYRLVQQWAWYSLDDDDFTHWGTYWGALFDPHTHQIKQLGVEFGKYAESLMPDFDLTGMRITYTPTYGISSTLGLLATVSNLGGTSYVTSTVRIDDGRASVTLPLIPPVQKHDLAWVPITYPIKISAPITLTMTVNPDNYPREVNRENNTILKHISVNLAGGNLTYELPEKHSAHPSVTLTVSVRNTGDVIIPESEVEFGIGEPGTNALGLVMLPSLGPEQQESVSLVWPDAPAGRHQVWAWVDPQNSIHESLETDNVLTADAMILSPTHWLYLPVGAKMGSSEASG